MNLSINTFHFCTKEDRSLIKSCGFLVFFFLQSAIEKLTHDYLNLFHFPPLIKVRKVFLTENMLLLLTYVPATSTPKFANVGDRCLKWNVIISVQQKALWVKLRMCMNGTTLFPASWNINNTVMIRTTHVTLVARGYKCSHCRWGPLASHLARETFVRHGSHRRNSHAKLWIATCTEG